MVLTGLHLLLTYRCILECEHCFVWGGPCQKGAMNLELIDNILEQAKTLKEMEWIYFEGGEPFLFYPVLIEGVRRSAELGYKVGIVSNAYWAEDPRDAKLWLEPIKDQLSEIDVSSDLYHSL